MIIREQDIPDQQSQGAYSLELECVEGTHDAVIIVHAIRMALIHRMHEAKDVGSTAIELLEEPQTRLCNDVLKDLLGESNPDESDASDEVEQKVRTNDKPITIGPYDDEAVGAVYSALNMYVSMAQTALFRTELTPKGLAESMKIIEETAAATRMIRQIKREAPDAAAAGTPTPKPPVGFARYAYEHPVDT